MSLKPAKPRSIASQLVLLFTLAAAFLLCSALGGFYLIVVRHTFEEDNIFLADKLSVVAADLEKVNWARALDDDMKTLRPDEHVAYWVRVLDGNGKVVAETRGMDKLLPLGIFPEPQTIPSELKPKNFRTQGKLFSLVASRPEGGARPYTVQLAQDRSADERFSREFRMLLLVMVAIGTLAAALIAIKVTERGLRPLVEMTHTVERIGPSHLDERVAPERWPRELRPLAVAFDDMIDRLRDSFTRLSQFSADIAHELRTPVANMLGEAQVSLTRTRTSDEYREVIESSVTECERLSGIIANLLFMARAEAGSESIQRARFDARKAAEKIGKFYETIAEEQGISIQCVGQSEVDADPMLFERAVSNVVENALRFTPAGGVIRIALEEHPKHCEISVADNGSGIAAPHLARVFDRFYRADSSRSSKGTGLGLALVKSIVDLHRGSARISSQLGQGTIVTLLFPKNPAAPV